MHIYSLFQRVNLVEYVHAAFRASNPTFLQQSRIIYFLERLSLIPPHHVAPWSVLSLDLTAINAYRRHSPFS